MNMVTCRIHHSRWTGAEGQTRYGCEIIADKVDLLAKVKEIGVAMAGCRNRDLMLSKASLARSSGAFFHARVWPLTLSLLRRGGAEIL